MQCSAFMLELLLHPALLLRLLASGSVEVEAEHGQRSAETTAVLEAAPLC